MRPDDPGGQPLVNHFRRVFDADREATSRVVRALGAMDRPPEKALERMAHVVAAGELWLCRCDPEAQERPDEVFPRWGIGEIGERSERLATRWSSWIAALVDTRLHQPVRYQALDGEWWESRLVEVLTHVANHATYHRGQCATDIARAGGEAPQTDYIVLTRRRAQPAGAHRHG